MWDLTKTITRVYQKLREAMCRVAELEGGRLNGEAEMEGSYFVGRCKRKRGRGAAGKNIMFGLLERDGKVQKLQPLKHLGKHYHLNHGKAFASRQESY